MLTKKLRSYGGIIKSSNHIMKRRESIKKIKNVNDYEILQSFCCTIETPLEVSETENIDKFNKLLIILCKLVGFYKIS
jgi:hypothetical protein